MKHLARLLSLLILVSAGFFYAGCSKKDDNQSEEETQLNKLKSDQWTLTSAKDPSDRTSEYPGMKLTISGTFSEGGVYHYTSSATSWPSVSPWKKESDWKFQAGAVSNTIIRLADDQVMNYTLSNGDKTLTIAFTYPESGEGFNNGRTESVSGDWTFVFTRP
ncbi:hypothetical protein [Chryseolinea lacunae]|uniref:Lipocalin-like domain-containing protein n=1 Tax=Chryseolinea lacunae TaxID=2801331 RepID=A0ABS1KUP7_9BACT|nr:hypothetical protein [Chryseolinea lacunae]MBL0742918.1 hypothetical protein [Chryseolinea lacunae]